MPVTLSAAQGLARPDAEILRCAQDDSQDTAQVLSREVFSPNVCKSFSTFFKRRSL